MPSAGAAGLHAPEYIAAVYHKVRWGEVDEAKSVLLVKGVGLGVWDLGFRGLDLWLGV